MPFFCAPNEIKTRRQEHAIKRWAAISIHAKYIFILLANDFSCDTFSSFIRRCDCYSTPGYGFIGVLTFVLKRFNWCTILLEFIEICMYAGIECVGVTVVFYEHIPDMASCFTSISRNVINFDAIRAAHHHPTKCNWNFNFYFISDLHALFKYRSPLQRLLAT